MNSQYAPKLSPDNFELSKLTEAEILNISAQLAKGSISVLPTDTIYGIVCSALIPRVVEKVYHLRKRSPDKPMIVLISKVDDIKKFEIKLTKKVEAFLKSIWPNPVSVILPCDKNNFSYLHRGKNSLAFRIPNNTFLLKVLELAGPLIAPSANPEGRPPAQIIEEAKKFFGNKVDFYVDGGKISGQPSTLIKLTGDSCKIIREGSYQLPRLLSGESLVLLSA